jgi:hypothetical protein
MREMQSTFDLSTFKNLNAPTFGGYAIHNFRFPKGNEIFGKTFYAIIDGTIYGLKILAWALCGNSSSPKTMFLIQTPKFTRWLHLYEYPLFTSVNDLVEGKNRFQIPVEWDYDVFKNTPTSLKMTNRGHSSSSRDWEIRQSFYFSKSDGYVRDSNTKIAYLVETPQGMFFGLEQREEFYNTKEECLSAKFNGMDIVDFAEPIVVEIKIEIPRTEVVTKKLVLK